MFLLKRTREKSLITSQLCITAVCLPGTEMGTVGESGERFIDNKRITGAIPDMLEEAVEFVRKLLDKPKSFKKRYIKA